MGARKRAISESEGGQGSGIQGSSTTKVESKVSV
jgi:hypothetical protein